MAASRVTLSVARRLGMGMTIVAPVAVPVASAPFNDVAVVPVVSVPVQAPSGVVVSSRREAKFAFRNGFRSTSPWKTPTSPLASAET